MIGTGTIEWSPSWESFKSLELVKCRLRKMHTTEIGDWWFWDYRNWLHIFSVFLPLIVDVVLGRDGQYINNNDFRFQSRNILLLVSNCMHAWKTWACIGLSWMCYGKALSVAIQLPYDLRKLVIFNMFCLLAKIFQFVKEHFAVFLWLFKLNSQSIIVCPDSCQVV